MSRAASSSTRWLPDLYSIRVILASFVPAERRNISVLPSSENRLDINLTGVFSTIGVTSTPAVAGYPDDRRLEVGVADVAGDPAGVAFPAGAGLAGEFVDPIGVHGIQSTPPA